MQQKAAAAGRSRASPGPYDSPTHRSADSLTQSGGSWTLPAGTQHSTAHGRPAVLGSPGGGIAGNANASGSLLSSTGGYNSICMGASLGSSSSSSGSMAAAVAVAAAQEAAAAARAVEDRLVLAEGRSMAAERAALEAARAAEAAGQRVAVLSTQLAAAAMQVQEECSQREAVASFNQQVRHMGKPLEGSLLCAMRLPTLHSTACTKPCLKHSPSQTPSLCAAVLVSQAEIYRGVCVPCCHTCSCSSVSVHLQQTCMACS